MDSTIRDSGTDPPNTDGLANSHTTLRGTESLSTPVDAILISNEGEIPPGNNVNMNDYMTARTVNLEVGSVKPNDTVVKGLDDALTSDGGAPTNNTNTLSLLETEEGEPPTDGTLAAWLVVFGCFSAHIWSVGFGASWGVYMRTLVIDTTFPGATTFQLSFVATVSFGVMIVASVFVGPLADRLDPRLMSIGGSMGMGGALLAASFANEVWQMYLTSALYGIGGCFTIVPSTVVLPAWFSKRRALAMGVSVSGTGVGAFLLAAVSQACLSAGGWRLGLRVLAGMCLGWMLLASLTLRRRRPAVPKKMTFLSLVYFKNPVFSLLFFSVMCLMLGFFSPQVFVPLMLSDGGYSNATGAAVVAAFSATVALGRIIGGFLVDKLGELNMFVLACAVPCLSTLCIWMPAPTNLGTTIAATMLWAFFCGSPLVSMPILAANEFGLANLGAVIGTLYLCFFPGETLGTAFSGLIVDANTYYAPDGTRLGANYRPMLAFLACAWFAGLVLILALRYLKVGWKVKVKV